MKKTSKIFSVILALALVFAMAIPAFAVDITITGGHEAASYSAWKLLDATHAPGGEGTQDDKYAYTINETYREVLKKVTSKTADADIIDYIDSLKDEEIRDFADEVYAEIKGMKADATAANSVFAGVAQGYYLIAETKTGDAADTYSLVMLDTAGQENIEVSTKEDVPTVEKKVEDVDGSSKAWQDSADLYIGDDVNFKITGTVSDKIGDYDTYSYVFHDTMSKGLTYNKDSAKVTIDGTEVSGYTVSAVEQVNGTTKLTVSFADVKAAGAKADSEIVLTYSAKLNDDAAIGKEGNDNEVYIEYDNNPYGDGTGTSAKDIVTVFTYQLVVNKTDKDGNALEGAGFTLSKKDGENWVQIGNEITDATTFTWKGLDAGEYKLEETTVPAGYNKAADVIFTVTAVHEAESDDPQLTSLTVTPSADFNVTLSSGKIETSIVNNSGTELPETGGMGTTILYIVGAILVVGAVVILISKKRMSAEA